MTAEFLGNLRPGVNSHHFEIITLSKRVWAGCKVALLQTPFFRWLPGRRLAAQLQRRQYN